MERKSAMKEEKKWMNRRQNGFTLVELIVVLVILSVVSAIAVPSVLGYIDDSKAKECQSQIETLAADVSSAKMAFEVNGEISEDGEVGGEFDATQIRAYIAAAGAEGRCPVDDVLYEYKEDEHKIICPKGHGEGSISGSGKFTVAVAEVTSKREPDDVLPPEDEEKNPGEENPDTNKPEPSVSVEVTPGSIDDLEEGESRELTAHVTPEGFDGKDNVEYHYRWESSDPSVTVTQTDGPTATVTGKSASDSSKVTCTVTVTYTENGEIKTVEDSVDVSVKVTDPKPEPSVSLEVTPGNIDDLGEGESRELTAHVTPEGFEGKDNVKYEYEWKSSDPSVTVTPTGDGSTATVAGGSAGDSSTVTCTVTVTYTENGETKKVEDSVDVPVKVTDPKPEPSVSLEVTPGNIDDLGEGESRELTAHVTPEGFEGKDNVKYEYEWKSSDPSVTVTPTGDGSTATVTGGSAGDSSTVTCTVTVTYTENGETKTVEDSVDVPVKVTDPKPAPSVSLEVTPGNIDDLGEGESRELTAHVTPEGFEGKDNVKYEYEWKSSDPHVTVTPTGDGSTATVTGGSAGDSSTVTCTVTVTYTENGETKTVEDSVDVPVNVMGEEPQTESELEPENGPHLELKVDPTEIELFVGRSHGVLAIPIPYECTLDTLQWESSNPDCVFIDGTTDQITVNITAKAVGTCEIKCTATAKEPEVSSKSALVKVTVKEVKDGTLLKGVPQPLLVNKNTNEHHDLLQYVKDNLKGTWSVSPSNYANIVQQWDGGDGKLSQADLRPDVERGEFNVTYTVDGQSETVHARAVLPTTGVDAIQKRNFSNGDVLIVGETKDAILSARINPGNTTDKAYFDYINWNPDIVQLSEIEWDDNSGEAKVKLTPIKAGAAKITAIIYCEYFARYYTQEITINVQPAYPKEVKFTPDPVNVKRDGEGQVITLVVVNPAGATIDGIQSISWEKVGNNLADVSELGGGEYLVEANGQGTGQTQLKARIQTKNNTNLEVMVTVNVSD